jgi:hypothetical protein
VLVAQHFEDAPVLDLHALFASASVSCALI